MAWWGPRALKMTRSGSGLWTRSFPNPALSGSLDRRNHPAAVERCGLARNGQLSSFYRDDQLFRHRLAAGHLHLSVDRDVLGDLLALDRCDIVMIADPVDAELNDRAIGVQLCARLRYGFRGDRGIVSPFTPGGLDSGISASNGAVRALSLQHPFNRIEVGVLIGLLLLAELFICPWRIFLRLG